MTTRTEGKLNYLEKTLPDGLLVDAAWMERHGVKVLDAALPLRPAIERAAERGAYSLSYMGHWLRCEIPLLEQEDEFVLYTDTDVVFLDALFLGRVRPPLFACAPEFRLTGANYVNTGVMVMNVPALRDTAPAFLDYAAGEIAKVEGVYHDQYAYNRFYRGQWTPLDPRYNWKPYWPTREDIRIIHFHGAKLGAVRTLLDGEGNWDDVWWRVVGSLVASFQPAYAEAIKATLVAVKGHELEERPWIEAIGRDLQTRTAPVPPEVVDLSFMNYDVGY